MNFLRKVKLASYIISSKHDISSKKEMLENLDIYLNIDELPMIPCKYAQVYDELSLVPDNSNYYVYFIDQLKQNFDIRCNIVDIGGGYIPRVAKRLAIEQIKMGRGNITVYDPRLIEKDQSIIILSCVKTILRKRHV